MTSWKTTIAGACDSLGKSLMGAGVVLHMTGNESKILVWLAFAGFIISAIGGFFGHLFAADSTCVRAAIEDHDTEILRRTVTGNPPEAKMPPS